MEQESKPIWNFLVSDIYMKWFLRACGLILTVFLVVAVIQAIQGKQVKIFGFEINTSIEQKEKDIRSNQDTSKPISPETRLSLPQTSSPQAKKIANSQEKKIAKKDSIPPSVSGDNSHNVGRDNNGINGNVTINQGFEQRHVTKQYAETILKRINDTLQAYGLTKDYPIKFGSTLGSDESFQFTKEVIMFLRSEGFSNIDNGISPTMGNSSLRVLKENDNLFVDVGQRH